jgi:hypothetical protein
MAFAVPKVAVKPTSEPVLEKPAMTPIVRWFKESLITLAISLLLIVGMLLVAVFVRPLLIVAFIAMFGVAVVSVFSPRVRAWLNSPA